MAERKKIERKKICGKLHKRIPCSRCGEPIWVANDLPPWLARCTSCTGMKELPGVGRSKGDDKTEED